MGWLKCWVIGRPSAIGIGAQIHQTVFSHFGIGEKKLTTELAQTSAIVTPKWIKLPRMNAKIEKRFKV
jgi:hypothetical protein